MSQKEYACKRPSPKRLPTNYMPLPVLRLTLPRGAGEPPVEWKRIPKKPGCYLFFDNTHTIIYAGKSKSLYHRVGSYFRNAEPKYGKLIEMIRSVHSLEIFLTDTETDALMLEYRFIKHYQPKFNAQLKRSPVYPFVRIDVNQPYPSITITKRKMNDACLYFGGFYHRDDAAHTLALLNAVWRVPLCGSDHFNGKQRPCLRYHMNQCDAPCAGLVDANTYRMTIMEIVRCLNGRFGKTVRRLRREMYASAEDLRFEHAARLRDHMAELRRLKKRRTRFYTDLDGKDVYLFIRAVRETHYVLFFIRNGVTLHRADFSTDEAPDIEMFAAFVHENRSGHVTVSEGVSLTACLMEIHARKRFVPIPRKTSYARILKKLNSAYRDFMA